MATPPRPPGDDALAAGELVWHGGGKPVEFGEFRKREYRTLAFDAFTQTAGSPHLLAIVRKSLDPSQPVFASRYLIVRLPFRLRWSERCSFHLRQEGTEIVSLSTLLNYRSQEEWFSQIGGDHATLPIGLDPFTWAMVYTGCRRIKGESLELIKNDAGDLKDFEKASQPEWDEREGALANLNRCVVAYWNAAGTAVQHNGLRLLNDADMLGEPHEWVTSISNSRESPIAVRDEWISFPATRKPRSSVPLFGGGLDLPASTIDKIKSSLSRDSDYPAYYFSFAGSVYTRNGEYQNALLYHVMAFESAHQHFLEFALEQLGVPEPMARATDLHMRAGISLLLKITMHLFLTAAERPTSDAIEKTKKAVELRNSWVHGKRDKQGRLHALQIGRVEISQLIKGVVECTNVLMALLP